MDRLELINKAIDNLFQIKDQCTYEEWKRLEEATWLMSMIENKWLDQLATQSEYIMNEYHFSYVRKMVIERMNIMEITKSKIIELPCFIGDKVYGIRFPTHAATWNKEKPTIVEMTVLKVSYEASIVRGEMFEKIRVDVAYKNNLGDDSYDFYIWDHDELFVCLPDAEEKLAKLTA